MEHPIHAINWFEIPVHDFKRAKTFYSTLYAYEMKVMELGPEKMGILPSDPEQGGISGAIVSGKDYRPMQTESKFISMETPTSTLSSIGLKLQEGRSFKRKP
jgi:predicted enzyme related to lactoylglutathione lyase